jgi:zinc transport system permease protein
MRVVGLLLVSALMIVPVAVAQLLAGSFARTMAVASGIGVGVSVVGLSITYWEDIPPGATIVLLAIALYALAAVTRPLFAHRRAGQAPHDPHPELPDDVDLAGTRGA